MEYPGSLGKGHTDEACLRDVRPDQPNHVACAAGAILDVVVDLSPSGPETRQNQSFHSQT
jgi:hypothetical protein